MFLAPLASVVLRASSVGFDLTRLAPSPAHRVYVNATLESSAPALTVEGYLPRNEPNLMLGGRFNNSDLTEFSEVYRGGNREVQWYGESAGRLHIETAFTVVAQSVRYGIDPKILVPSPPVDHDRPFLRATAAIQADDPDIATLAERLAPAGAPELDGLVAIYDYCRALRSTGPADSADARTTLQRQAGDSKGKSCLFVALARHQGMPARLVTGVPLEEGKNILPVTWVEVRVGPTWVPFCPTRGLFARTDGRLVPFFRGEHTFFRANGATRFDTRFSVERVLAVRGKLAGAAEAGVLSFRGLWGELEGAGIPLDILRVIIMFPLGALVCVLLRNVVGLKTIGFFLPMLLAAAAVKVGLLWGLFAVGCVVLSVGTTRLLIGRLKLLHYPQIAILISSAVFSALGIAAIATWMGKPHLAQVVLFPFAIMTLTTETLSVLVEQEGVRESLKIMLQTVVSVAAAYVVMSNWTLESVMLAAPELALIAVVIDILLGRWMGMRLFEYWRFRKLLRPPEVNNA